MTDLSKISEWQVFSTCWDILAARETTCHVATITGMDPDHPSVTTLVSRGNAGVFVTHHGVVSHISPLYKILSESFGTGPA